jgi:endonuclease/exonuclease/phosphatase (EEP) superfamily protein YafD
MRRRAHQKRPPLLLSATGALLALLAALGQAGRWIPALDAFNSGAPAIALCGAMVALTALVRGGRRRVGLIAGLLALLLAGERCAGEFFRPIEVAQLGESGFQVTVVTHNVLVSNHSPEQTVRALAASGADVLLLQEADGSVGPLLPGLDHDYPYQSQCPRHRCSLIILSRWPITHTRYRIRDAAGEQIGPRLVWATIAPPGGPSFDVATLHMPWPIPAGPPAEQRTELAGSIGRLNPDRLILTGDLNLTPWALAMDRLDASLAPLTRVTRALWSFPARLTARATSPTPFLPIDHVFAGPGWAVRSVERLPRTGSDHYPVRVRLVARR